MNRLNSFLVDMDPAISAGVRVRLGTQEIASLRIGAKVLLLSVGAQLAS